jgi:DNA-directed RNA polymerase subunit omega
MARITVEDCLEFVPNRFCLVRLAAKRAKQLLTGSKPVTDIRGNREIVGALREIADGKVRFITEEQKQLNALNESFELPPATEQSTQFVSTPNVENIPSAAQ